jgi:hypothetical protein
MLLIDGQNGDRGGARAMDHPTRATPPPTCCCAALTTSETTCPGDGAALVDMPACIDAPRGGGAHPLSARRDGAGPAPCPPMANAYSGPTPPVLLLLCWSCWVAWLNPRSSWMQPAACASGAPPLAPRCSALIVAAAALLRAVAISMRRIARCNEAVIIVAEAWIADRAIRSPGNIPTQRDSLCFLRER